MNIVTKITEIMTGEGASAYLGEAVSMQEHFLQCAEHVSASGASDELVVAALLHDIGHFGQYFDIDVSLLDVDRSHGELGARILSPHFGPAVVEPVRLHIPAKRYLCATDADYFGRLSGASVQSLSHQGGPMDASEIDAFRRNKYYESAVLVRRADDNAKIVGARTRTFDDFTPLLHSVSQTPHA